MGHGIELVFFFISLTWSTGLLFWISGDATEMVKKKFKIQTQKVSKPFVNTDDKYFHNRRILWRFTLEKKVFSSRRTIAPDVVEDNGKCQSIKKVVIEKKL